MRVCPVKLALLACVFAAACSRSSSTGQPLLASSSIGPEGGVMVVETGNQAGMILTVPAGAVTEFVEFRVFDEAVQAGSLGPGGGSNVMVPAPGMPFRIEPADLVLSTNATLRMPYVPGNMPGFAPGNVRARQVSPVTTREYDPESVSVSDSWLEVRVKTFGRFQVVRGERAANLTGYLPVVGSEALLTGGFELVVEPDDSPSSISLGEGVLLRVMGPGFDEALVMLNGEILGRRSGLGTWLEDWSQPYSTLQRPEVALTNTQPFVMDVQSPVGGLPISASMMCQGFYQLSEPIEHRGRLALDIMKLSIAVAYNRADLGVGQREMIYWLSPEDGLLSLSIDGVVYDRIP